LNESWLPARTLVQKPAPHVESLFVKANEPGGRRAIWLRLTLLRSADGGTASLWVMRWSGRGSPEAWKESWPLAELRPDAEAPGGELPGGGIHAGGAAGSLRAGRISFAVEWDNAEAPMLGLPSPWMYAGGWPRSKLWTPAPRAVFRGGFSWDGERWDLSGWIGMQGHNWGKGHSPAYRWAQASAIDPVPGSGASGSATVEAFSGRVPLGPLLTPWMSAVLIRADGIDLSLHRPLPRPGRLTKDGLLRWALVAQEGGHRARFDAWARPEDSLGLRYEDPDGTVRHCLNCTIASVELVVEARRAGAWARLGAWRGDGCAATEALTEREDHGIPVLA
jgi:hypothetical protein